MELNEKQIADEMSKMEYEPLLPVEMALIRWSLGIGVVSLVVLYWVSAVFFPAAHGTGG